VAEHGGEEDPRAEAIVPAHEVCRGDQQSKARVDEQAVADVQVEGERRGDRRSARRDDPKALDAGDHQHEPHEVDEQGREHESAELDRRPRGFDGEGAGRVLSRGSTEWYSLVKDYRR
jgi:hypothetical protein